MMTFKLVAATGLAALLTVNPAWSQEDNGDDTDATIRLMGNAEAELPDAVTKEIQLPDNLAEDSAAVENSAEGLTTANENRMRREDGLTTADEAQRRGAEMMEAAQEDRENRGRSEDRPEPPETPDLPDTPNPQGNS